METPKPPPHVYGDPQITIALPNAGDKLGLRFSVFGKCSAISPTSGVTVTVSVLNGANKLDSKTAVQNGPRGTYEAFFDLPAGTSVPNGTGSVVVTCTGINGNATNAQLTIGADSSLGITRPTTGQAFADWASVMAGGTVGVSDATFWLRVTDAGFDVIPFQTWTGPAAGAWQSAVGQVANQANLHTPSRYYNVHVSIWNSNAEVLRMSSGFFSVTG